MAVKASRGTKKGKIFPVFFERLSIAAKWVLCWRSMACVCSCGSLSTGFESAVFGNGIDPPACAGYQGSVSDRRGTCSGRGWRSCELTGAPATPAGVCNARVTCFYRDFLIAAEPNCLIFRFGKPCVLLARGCRVGGSGCRVAVKHGPGLGVSFPNPEPLHITVRCTEIWFA